MKYKTMHTMATDSCMMLEHALVTWDADEMHV